MVRPPFFYFLSLSLTHTHIAIPPSILLFFFFCIINNTPIPPLPKGLSAPFLALKNIPHTFGYSFSSLSFLVLSLSLSYILHTSFPH